MNINDSITFWQYPDYIKKKVNGVSFRVLSATSNFRAGKFYQDLDLIINTFGPSDKQWATESGTDDSQDRAETKKLARQGNSESIGLKPVPASTSTTPPTGAATAQTPGTEESPKQTYTQYEGGRE